MKPIHHALVSARLFGGRPEDYVSLHNHFDMSKAALPDMRHRAALHSVDHGTSVMKMVFSGKEFPGTSLENLCFQHVNDDQGFDVKLDDWLKECTIPSFIRLQRRPPQGLHAFREDPVEACIQKWGGQADDYRQICDYYELPEKASDHPIAPAVSRNAFSIYFSESIFGPAISVQRNDGRPRYVPVRDIGECITLAHFNRIPTLGDVLSGMSQKNWMLGSRVKNSRRLRCANAQDPNLFSTEVPGCEEFRPTQEAQNQKVTAILSD